MSTFLPSFRRRRPTIVNPRQAAKIPLEIEFLIIDYFEGDTIHLHSFRLVSPDWASYAGFLLFRSVCVRDSNVKRFLAVLQTRNNLGRHIITLIVQEARWPRDENRPSILDTLGPALSDKMGNLQALELSNRYFSRDGVQLATGWASISRLRVRFSGFATAKDMMSFFAAFPRLNSLDVSQCTSCDIPMQPLQCAIPVPAWHLNYLALAQCPQSTLVDWLVADPGEITVDHLRIVSFEADASPFNALLKKIGRGLRHLEVPPQCRVILGAEVPLSIHDCTALTTVNFFERGDLDHGPDIVSLLPQVRSPNLTTVSFEIYLTTAHLNDIRRWEQVNDVLAMDAFANLEKILVNMWGAPFASDMAVMSFDEGTSIMKSRLALLEARGLLQFTSPDVVPQITAVEYQSPHKPSMRNRISRKLAGWMRRR
ncbi:hypothetical protein MSAN_01947200 [Mycena sanguinolenta]|uniref:F-box domain-containing protein n=1 Tax=Mycena sanguinolenta TaxID=230812 RepID=A0A8H7CMX7_9AGAR|nr:hypothetical protein MSAN_01947200 [Mycena sanguinolenta]